MGCQCSSLIAPGSSIINVAAIVLLTGKYCRVDLVERPAAAGEGRWVVLEGAEDEGVVARQSPAAAHDARVIRHRPIEHDGVGVRDRVEERLVYVEVLVDGLAGRVCANQSSTSNVILSTCCKRSAVRVGGEGRGITRRLLNLGWSITRSSSLSAFSPWIVCAVLLGKYDTSPKPSSSAWNLPCSSAADTSIEPAKTTPHSSCTPVNAGNLPSARVRILSHVMIW